VGATHADPIKMACKHDDDAAMQIQTQ